MSTRAIREALEAFRIGKPVDRETWFQQALAEVEAIEKAARVISDDATVHAIQRDDEDAVDAAADLLLAVSEGAPKT